MKLSERQRKVVEAMRSGYYGEFVLVGSGSAYLKSEKGAKRKVNITIFKNLENMNIVKCNQPNFALKQYRLTELGKTITL